MKFSASIFAIILILSSATFAEKKQEGKKEFSVLCKVFLGTDEKANTEILGEVKRITEAKKHSIHTIIFPAAIQNDKGVQDEIKMYNVATFPALIIDEKILDKTTDLGKTVEEASKIDRVILTPHLEKDVDEKKNLIATCYICCFIEGQSVENGRLMVYAVDETPQKDGCVSSIFKTLIVDNREYNIESASCHAPKTFYWPIPQDTDPKYIKLIMIAYDGKGKILGTCCSSECSEIPKD